LEILLYLSNGSLLFSFFPRKATGASLSSACEGMKGITEKGRWYEALVGGVSYVGTDVNGAAEGLLWSFGPADIN